MFCNVNVDDGDDEGDDDDKVSNIDDNIYDVGADDHSGVI